MPPRKGVPWGATVRMVAGSAFGILGFGTLSAGFVQLNAATMGIGVLEVAVGTFLALGVMAPLRGRRASRGG
jgi:hypothetical protein